MIDMRSSERFGKVAYIRYQGGAFGEDTTDKHMDEPMRVVLGMGDVCPGMEQALFEMEEGERRILIIKPEDAYGPRDPQAIETYPRVMLPGGDKLEVGSVLGRMNPQNGIKMPVRVIDANETHVTMDFNHPLAGKTLQYEVVLDGVE
ncbi:MAG: FKBP-type peptidyl-prolyl cis-trans isomerase [Eggerthellaceae bacterium]|nr:FKBP-type peptidyl-prolyl cis-trans isomerase [Eggerthellaceae bacterium]